MALNLAGRRAYWVSTAFAAAFVLYGLFFHFSQEDLLQGITTAKLAGVEVYSEDKAKEETARLHSRAASMSATVAKLTARQLENSQAFNLQKDGIASTLEPFMDYAEIAAIEVTDKDNRAYASMWKGDGRNEFRVGYTMPPAFRDKYRFVVRTPAVAGDETQGFVTVYVDDQAIAEQTAALKSGLRSAADTEITMLRDHFRRTLLPQVLVLLCGIAFVIASSRAIARSYGLIDTQRRELAAFNLQLEHKVRERTQELETQNRKLEQTTNALRETSSLLEVLLDNTPVYIYFKDAQSRYVRFSKSLLHAFRQADAAALQGKTDFDFFVQDHARESFADEQGILRTGEPITGRTEKLLHADGRQEWALTTKMPWRDKDGRIIGTFGISSDLTAIKATEAQLETAHRQLVDASRQAGMAEIATNVLHNVGNVLNSVNVSAALIIASVRASKVQGLTRAVQLIGEHAGDLGTFLTSDAKGKMLPAYLGQLAPTLVAEQDGTVQELMVLTKSVDHIKEIIAAQQAHAGASSLLEPVQICELLEDALRMSAGNSGSSHVRVVKDFPPVPELLLDKRRILQIVVNLIRNARQAMEAVTDRERRLTLTVGVAQDQTMRIGVADTGEGIAPENITRVFAHGFTTKKDGHGFGLHSAAIAAGEMGGTLAVHSDGTGTGATFTLALPIRQTEAVL